MDDVCTYDVGTSTSVGMREKRLSFGCGVCGVARSGGLVPRFNEGENDSEDDGEDDGKGKGKNVCIVQHT